MTILFFSATGNSLYVAKRLGGERYSIPKLLKQGKFEFEDDKIGIVYPTNYMSVPKIVREFLSKATLKSDYIFAVTTTGHPFGPASKRITELGKELGICFAYSVEIGMVDNYLPGFDMEKELKKLPSRNVEQRIDKVIKDIGERKVYIQKPPVVLSLLLKIANADNIKRRNFSDKFSVNSSCNNCGICAKVCPVDNIKVLEKPVFGNACVSCHACVQHCPQEAIRIKNEKGTKRYVNENVTTKEIIDAND
jgi:ferredoxin